jgi:hypothetical protein
LLSAFLGADLRVGVFGVPPKFTGLNPASLVVLFTHSSPLRPGTLGRNVLRPYKLKDADLKVGATHASTSL